MDFDCLGIYEKRDLERRKATWKHTEAIKSVLHNGAGRKFFELFCLQGI